MRETTRRAIETAMGCAVRSAAPVSGGDINDAFLLRLGDGREVFAKTHRAADPRMFPAEARGLTWLAEAQALRVPNVLAVSEGAGETAFLVLEYLRPKPRVKDFDARLGEGLAMLHRYGAASFGFLEDNFIGSLPQQNQATSSWAEFYRSRRLGPQLKHALAAGLLDVSLARSLESLLGDLEGLVGEPEPPARLHGDLWSGNLHVDERGEPALIDPAAYAGHREVDLAMMRLFGGFERRTFEAYTAAYPLSPGHEERVALYQIYPLLVHVNLFGRGYVAQLRSRVEKYT